MINLASSSNSTKHGITSTGFLSCKKDKCLYFSQCFIKDEISAYPYGYPCPLELLKASVIEEAYSNEMKPLPIDKRAILIGEITKAELQKHRLEQYVSMNGCVPGCRGNDDAIPPHILLRYYKELIGRRLKLYKKAKKLLAQFR